MPTGVVTRTFAVPTELAGVITVIWVGLSTVKLAVSAKPKLTTKALVKLDPVMTTLMPPPGTPALGLTLVMVGASS